MDKSDGAGIGGWPVLLLVLGLIGGATATQVLQRAPDSRQDAGATANFATAPAPPSASAVLLGLLGLGAPEAEPAIDLLFARARDAAASRGISIEFMVATLPDYVDSNSGWSFDPILDAVQRAAGASDFVLDRFYLPDWAPGAAAGADPATGRRHETEPGLVLFRDVDADTATTRVLAFFIVTETPTAGIHEAAFLGAAGFVAAWHQSDDYELRVLGPTFSGSSPSLRRAIQSFLEGASYRPREVRVLSGSATSRTNQQLLTFEWPAADAAPVPVRFAATVRADDVMLHTLHDHLTDINGQWECGAGVVLLVESNTGYGQGFSRGRADGLAPASGAAADDAPGADVPCGAVGDPFPEALRIPFPIHISRLRAEVERLRTAAPRPAAGAGLGTMLSDIGPATDQLPSMTPQITAAAIDSLVGSILATIRREEYPAIGIFATDKRDHLFLAERIVREVPNALLFTTEADLIYVHPEFRSFVRGAIVASSYPLFNPTQAITSPHLGSRWRQQFSSMAAQGVYNAVLKLLARDDLLVDYLPPGCLTVAGGEAILSDSSRCQYPPVWISVAGRDGLWPIDSHVDDHEAEALEGAPYTAAIDRMQFSGIVSGADGGGAGTAGAGSLHTDESAAAHALLHMADWMQAFFVLLLLALLVHMLAYVGEIDSVGGGRTRLAWWSRWLPIERWRVGMERLTAETWRLPGARLLHVGGVDEQSVVREHRLFLLIAFTILWFASVWAMRLFNIWLDEASIVIPPLAPEHGQTQDGAAVWYVLYGGIFALLIFESTLSILHRRAFAPQGWVAGTIVTGVALYLAFQAALSLAGFIGSSAWSDPVSARLLFARTVNPDNWVSPAAPILALLGVLYLWTLWNVRQLLMGGWMYRRSSEIFQMLTGREPQLTDEVADVMASPWYRQDWRCLAIPFGLLLLFVLYVPMWYTPDGLSFDQFLWWGSLLIGFLVAHSLAMTVHLWLLVRRILRHLFGHPIAGAFVRVAEEPFNWQLSLTPPRAVELKPMARKARLLRLELRQIIGDRAGGEAPLAAAQGERRRADAHLPVPIAAGGGADTIDAAATAAGALEVRQQDVIPIAETLGLDLSDALDEEMQEGGRQPYFKSRAWQTLLRLSDGLVPSLRYGYWRRGGTTTRPALDGWYRNAEALVGMQVAFVLRDLLARLVSGMTVTIVGAVIALASHLFYSFPGRSAMLALDWILIALAVTAAAAMLIRLEKDPILNRLWSRTPGRLIWTGGFVYRLGLYGAVPIITLFAWQFPEVGGMLFSWMEPLQKAIP